MEEFASSLPEPLGFQSRLRRDGCVIFSKWIQGELTRFAPVAIVNEGFHQCHILHTANDQRRPLM